MLLCVCDTFLCAPNTCQDVGRSFAVTAERRECVKLLWQNEDEEIQWDILKVNYSLTMSLTVRIVEFRLPKAKSNLIGRVEFRGKCSTSDDDKELINKYTTRPYGIIPKCIKILHALRHSARKRKKCGNEWAKELVLVENLYSNFQTNGMNKAPETGTGFTRINFWCRLRVEKGEREIESTRVIDIAHPKLYALLKKHDNERYTTHNYVTFLFMSSFPSAYQLTFAVRRHRPNVWHACSTSSVPSCATRFFLFSNSFINARRVSMAMAKP